MVVKRPHILASIGAILLASTLSLTASVSAQPSVGVVKLSPGESAQPGSAGAAAAAAAATSGMTTDPLAPHDLPTTPPPSTSTGTSTGTGTGTSTTTNSDSAPTTSLSVPTFTMPGQAPQPAKPRTYEKTIVAPYPQGAPVEPLADIYYQKALKEEDPGQAGALYMAAIGEMDKAGTRDDKYATCMSNLAAIELKDNQIESAEGHVKKSLDASHNHALQAKNYQLLGDIKAKQNNLEDADRNYSAVLDIFAKDGDMGHEQAAVLEKLASIKERMGKSAEASALRVKATDLATFASTNSGAQNLYKQGTKALIGNNYPEAIKFFEAALKEQPKFSAAKMNLAICYQHEALEHNNKKEYDQAEANYRLALPAMESAFGAKHAYVCTVLQGLTETLENENKLADAEQSANQWVTIEREINTSGAPVLNALRAYSRILKAEKKDTLAAEIDKEITGEKPLQVKKSVAAQSDDLSSKDKKDVKVSKDDKPGSGGKKTE